MQKKGLLWVAPVALLAIAMACGGDKKPASPTSPSSSASVAGASAASDAVTLKVNAPALVSPVGGARLTTMQATLTFQAATAKYVTGETFTYRVQLMDAGSTVIEEKVGAGTSYTMATQFQSDTLYRWKVRAEQQGQAGPWSATETFKSMEKPSSYLKTLPGGGSELYDALDDGKTIGGIVGNVTLIPGKGAQINDGSSWIEYTLPQQLTAGEYSALISNLSSDGPEVKTKVMAMKEGDADITDNEYRFTIEKRGNGVVAWRVIVGRDDQIDTVGAERVGLAFHESLEYFFKATWGGSFNLEIFEGGLNGNRIYSFGKSYFGTYQPLPHKVMAGCSYSPRSGPQSVPGMVIRQIWVSSNPRPSWAK